MHFPRQDNFPEEVKYSSRDALLLIKVVAVSVRVCVVAKNQAIDSVCVGGRGEVKWIWIGVEFGVYSGGVHQWRRYSWCHRVR